MTVNDSRFVLLSRPGCHLCDDMKALLDSVLPGYDQGFVEESVDSRPDWRERFGDVIPVLLRDGKPIAKVRLERDRLIRLLRGGRKSS